MVVIYCYLERGNYKVLKFHVNVSFTLKEAPLSFKRRPPISTTHLSPEIKNLLVVLIRGNKGKHLNSTN